MKKSLILTFIIGLLLIPSMRVKASYRYETYNDISKSEFIKDLTASKTDEKIEVTFTLKQDIAPSEKTSYGCNVELIVRYSGSSEDYSFHIPDEKGKTYKKGEKVTLIVNKNDDLKDEYQGKKLSEVYDKLDNILISLGNSKLECENIEYDLTTNKLVSVVAHDSNLMNRVESLLREALGAGWRSFDQSPTYYTDTDKYEDMIHFVTDPSFLYRTKENERISITIENTKNKSDEEIKNEIRKYVDNKTIYSAIGGNNIITKDKLANLKNHNNKLTLSAYENENTDKALYSWTFDGSKMTGDLKDINLSIKIADSENKETIEGLVPNKDKSLVLDFEHSGVLPDNTMVKVYVGDKFKDGEYIDLYFYNPETKKIEKVDTTVTLKDGYAEFKLAHCSEYVLTLGEKPKDEKPTTPTTPSTGSTSSNNNSNSNISNTNTSTNNNTNTNANTNVNTSTSNSNNNSNSNNAQTGTINVVLYSILSCVSLIGIVGIILKQKKFNN